jgi:hypothetical protein
MKRSACLFAMLTLLFAGSTATVRAQGLTPVTIVLSAHAVVEDTVVTLDEIAKISGGPDDLRRRLARLDIAELKLGAHRLTITSDLVRYRLLIAGIEPSRFRLIGAAKTIVAESDQPVSLRKIIAAAEQALQDNYPGDLSVVTVSPGRGINVPTVEVGPTDRVRLDAKMKSQPPRVGRARVDVAIAVNGKTREVVPVFFDLAEIDLASMLAAPLPKQGIRPAGNYPLQVDPKEVIVIKSKDAVRIVALIGTGPARVEATGEAMEDGKLGQVIRVRNLESNRTVSGRVEARGLVLMD